MGPGVQALSQRTWVPAWLSSEPWASYLISLSLSVLLCQQGPALQRVTVKIKQVHSCEDSEQYLVLGEAVSKYELAALLKIPIQLPA